MKQQICILGSTGSIGTQALDVIDQHPDLYEAYALTANNHWELLAEQARKFKPSAVVIANESYYQSLTTALLDMPGIKVYAGNNALCQIVEASPIDMVLTAMVGFSGLKPTIHAIKAHKRYVWLTKKPLLLPESSFANSPKLTILQFFLLTVNTLQYFNLLSEKTTMKLKNSSDMFRRAFSAVFA